MFRSVTFSFFPYIFLLWVEHGYFSTSCVDLCLSFTFLWALIFKQNIITNFWTTGNYFSRHFLAIWGDLFWYSAIFFLAVFYLDSFSSFFFFQLYFFWFHVCSFPVITTGHIKGEGGLQLLCGCLSIELSSDFLYYLLWRHLWDTPLFMHLNKQETQHTRRTFGSQELCAAASSFSFGYNILPLFRHWLLSERVTISLW